MNNITMIRVDQLYHHPENPRLQLGDLTELAESIRQNGIMQNLTVVEGHWIDKEEWVRMAKAEGISREEALGCWDVNSWDRQGYTVVIGNRRMEASKIAGLTEVPCVISDMTREQQIMTMLQENMQRADLTVYEQAQGFQMMINLGFKPEEISEKTGFSETTVRRRLKMAEMDPKLLKKACEAKGTERQVTLFDFERLAQVESIKERNALLKDIGDKDFDWKLKRSISMQHAKAVRKDAMKELKEAGIKQLESSDEYSSKYDQLYNERVDLGEWTPGKKLIPKSKEPLFFYMTEDSVKFYTKAKPPKKAEPVQKTEEEKKKEQEVENAWKIVDRITKTSAELRLEFVEGMTVKPSNAMQMLRWAIIAGMSDMLNHNYKNWQGLKNSFELQGTYTYEMVDDLEKKIIEMSQNEWPVLILCMFEGYTEEWKDAESFADGYRKEMPRWKRNTRLEQCYKWLTEFGYQMSTEEIEMMSGTHSVFKTGKE